MAPDVEHERTPLATITPVRSWFTNPFYWATRPQSIGFMSFRIISYRNLSYLRFSVNFYIKELHIIKNLVSDFSKSNITNSF